MKDLRGRTAVITGAASGLGREFARRAHAEGMRLVLADVEVEPLKALVAELGADGCTVLGEVVDVSRGDEVGRLAERAYAEFGDVALLFNNAGVGSGGSLLDAPMDEWHWMLNLNLLGVVRGCRLFAPRMVAAGGGAIVNVASFAGLAGAPGLMTYSVAKAGVVALSESLRAELHGHGVRVSVVCPSFFRTNLTENFRGHPKMLGVANKLMDHARESADDIAAAVFAQAQAGAFLILPTAAETWRWRLKRFLPGVYFRKLLQLAGGRMAKAAP